MKTQPQPAAQANTATTTDLNPSAKLQTNVQAYLDAQIVVGKKFESLIELAMQEREDRKYDATQTRAVIQSAFRLSYEKLGKRDKLEGDALKAYVEVGMKKSGPDISKVVVMAYPKSPEAATELAKAEDPEALAAVGISKPLGLNAKLEIARGNTTVAAIAAERQNANKGATTETARPPSGTTSATSTSTTTPQPPTPESAATQKLTPKERFENQFRATVKVGISFGLTFEEISDLIPDLLADMAAEAKEASESSATQANPVK